MESQRFSDLRLMHWLEPRSADRDEAFRERTIRVTVGIIIIGTIAGIFNSLYVYHDTWELISFPTGELVALMIVIIAGIAIHRGRIAIAAWCLLGVVFYTGVMDLLLEAYKPSVALPI